MTRDLPPWSIRHDPRAVRAYVDARDFPVRAILRQLDACIRRALPGVRAGMKWGVPFYYLEGPVCYLCAARAHVTFGFVQDARIRDPSGRLTGTGKSPIRKAVISVDAGDLPTSILTGWLQQARALDARWQEPRPAKSKATRSRRPLP